MASVIASVPGSKALRRLVRRLSGLDTELALLRERVEELEEQALESRRLHQRVAELTDVVAEVLMPAADRDDERLRTALDAYRTASF